MKRTLVRRSSGTFYVSLPKKYVSKFGWKKGMRVYVRAGRGMFTIKPWIPLKWCVYCKKQFEDVIYLKKSKRWTCKPCKIARDRMVTDPDYFPPRRERKERKRKPKSTPIIQDPESPDYDPALEGATEEQIDAMLDATIERLREKAEESFEFLDDVEEGTCYLCEKEMVLVVCDVRSKKNRYCVDCYEEAIS